MADSINSKEQMDWEFAIKMHGLYKRVLCLSDKFHAKYPEEKKRAESKLKELENRYPQLKRL